MNVHDIIVARVILRGNNNKNGFSHVIGCDQLPRIAHKPRAQFEEEECVLQVRSDPRSGLDIDVILFSWGTELLEREGSLGWVDTEEGSVEIG
jgi:hypothetical protein